MSLSELYHVGIVVPDIAAARQRLSSLLGVEWGPTIEADTEVRTASGSDEVVSLKLCYSTKVPYLELVEERPGTPWICNEYSNLHHIGFFSDSLSDDSRKLEGGACPLEICGRDGDDAPRMFSYHRDPLGVRFEYVDGASRTMMEDFLFKADPDSDGAQ
jgi:Glyoxalase/Bleomycin resistance protein/Dioxygenase superfamily